MDLKNKKSILKQLARKDDEVALNALKKEMDKVSLILGSSSNYEELSSNLDILDGIAYRVHFKAVTAIKEFLGREEELTLSYEEQYGFSSEEKAKYHNNNTLIIQALKVLEHIRYHEPERIMDIFFKYCAHENGEVSKQAFHGLIEYAKYNLEIFYGDGKQWSGLGPQPQEKTIEKISSLDDEEKSKLFDVIKSLCQEMLSPTITGTSSTYKTVTWTTAPISSIDEVKIVRRNALGILKTLYPLANNPKEKKAVLGAMLEASHTPTQTDYSDEVFSMILGDTVNILEFIKETVSNENLEVTQSIEKNIYFFYRRGTTKKEHNLDLETRIQTLILEIKEIIDQNSEYQIFKILIGFEGVFGDWKIKGEEKVSRDFQLEKETREAKAEEFAKSVTTNNFPEWKKRILEYAEIESDDLATFPYFGKFLQLLAKNSPTLSIELISAESQKLERFLVSILLGLWESPEKATVQKLVSSWIKNKSYLFSIARFLSFADEFDEELLKAVFNAAKTSNDLITLTQVISAASAQYKENNQSILEKLFLPSIEELTKNNNTDWVHEFWFRKEKGLILSNIGSSGCEIVLQNLLFANEISYQHEEVLAELAKEFAELVIGFFCNRIVKEKNKDVEGRYEAIPFSFHTSLADSLSNIPEKAVDIVYEQYDDNYGMFIYRGGRLLKNIFPELPPTFSKKLIDLIHKNSEKEILFVLGILRNYEGDARIQGVCKELVKMLPDEGSLLNETIITLQSTGVVSGEYGFAEAYESKIVEIEPWLDDKDDRVREFAKNYISNLKERIRDERQRSDERIALMKHQYGGDEQ